MEGQERRVMGVIGWEAEGGRREVKGCEGFK
jgi:hypothetical protein